MSTPVLQSGAPGAPELLVAVLTVLVPLAVSVYVYRDANRRGCATTYRRRRSARPGHSS